MKSVMLVFASTLLAAFAQGGDTLGMLRVKIACRDPFRIVDGKLYDLTPRFNYEIAFERHLESGTGKPTATRMTYEWEYIFGRAVQNSEAGLLLRKYKEWDRSMVENSEPVFIRNYPRVVVDGKEVECFAIPAKPYSYTNVSGSRSTVESYDYGILPTEAEVERLKSEARKKFEEDEAKLASESAQKSEAQKKAMSEAAAKRQVEADAKVFSFFQKEAVKGNGYYQFRLGKKYLGGDGVAMDIKLAKFWLNCACTNGESDATNLLAKIAIPGVP